MTRRLELMISDKDRLTVATDRITLKISLSGNMGSLMYDEAILGLEKFIKIVNEKISYPTTLRGMLTFDNGFIKSDLLVNNKKVKRGLSISYDVVRDVLNVCDIEAEEKVTQQ